MSSAELCTVVDHPVLTHKLSYLRRKDTAPAEFRRLLTEISAGLALEITRDATRKAFAVETPLESTRGQVVDETLVLVAVLRAGAGMLDGMLQMLPFAKVGHIGLYRDKDSLKAVEYYRNVPAVKGARYIVLDPMLATGETAAAALDIVQECAPWRVQLVSVLAAREGIAKVKGRHPRAEIFTLSIERQLNAKAYMLPGLGDAGDRVYNSGSEHA